MAFDLDEDELRATRKMNKADRNEIEVNDYVRTKNGVIDKVDALYGMIENTVHLENQKWFDIKNIVKHSKQLIDLVECGDFVNGYRVTDKYLFAGGKPVLETEGNDTNCKCLCEKDIKIILTKESYMANCYKVGGKDE